MVFALGIAVGALTLQTLDGREMVMSNYAERRGTVVLFMSSRSKALQECIPAVMRIYEKHRREEVLYVGLFPNDAESAEEIRAWCQHNEINFPVYRDPGGRIARQFGATVIPETFLLDPQGVLVYHGGFVDASAATDIEETFANVAACRPIQSAQHVVQGTPIDEAGVKQDAQDPIVPFAFSSELIFEKIPWTPDHHCSTIAECPNGDLVCVWFGGSYECADDQALFIARRRKGERAWTTPEKFVTGAFLHPPGNAVVFRVKPTRIMVAWDRMDGTRPMRCGRWAGGQLMYRYSDDNGYTWSDDREWCEPTGGMRNVPYTLRTGELLLPVSGGQPYFWITSDGGDTWRKSGSINEGGQPTIIQRDDGSLLAYLRSKPLILQSESRDAGMTWSPAQPTQLNCPGAGLAMCRLRSGPLVLVFDDSPLIRTPLRLAVSTDQGATWAAKIDLESNPGEYSYPCVIQTSDGRIHVTYTFLRRSIKHVELDENYITFLTRPQ